jgi:hypothetical protein
MRHIVVILVVAAFAPGSARADPVTLPASTRAIDCALLVPTPPAAGRRATDGERVTPDTRTLGVPTPFDPIRTPASMRIRTLKMLMNFGILLAGIYGVAELVLAGT